MTIEPTDIDVSFNAYTADIKHLVIAGGGHYGLTMYGILRDAHKYGLWKIDNIKSMYGTSIGAFVCVIMCMGYNWDTLDKYIIDRPWHDVFHFDIYTIMNAFEQKGMFTKDVMHNMLKPLFLGKDIPLDITLKGFFDLNGIDLTVTTTEVNTLVLTPLSHKTHPTWKLVDAIYASCTLPIVFSPIITDTCCYIDGGLFATYPIELCINDNNKPNEIFGIRKLSGLESINITNESSFFDFLLVIFRNIMRKFNTNLPHQEIVNEIHIEGGPISINGIIEFATSVDSRKKLIDYGSSLFKTFIANKNKTQISK